MFVQVCLVMELAKGGEVFDKLLEYGSLPEPEAAKLLAQASNVLLYFQSMFLYSLCWCWNFLPHIKAFEFYQLFELSMFLSA